MYPREIPKLSLASQNQVGPEVHNKAYSRHPVMYDFRFALNKKVRQLRKFILHTR